MLAFRGAGRSLLFYIGDLVTRVTAADGNSTKVCGYRLMYLAPMPVDPRKTKLGVICVVGGVEESIVSLIKVLSSGMRG